MRQTDFVNDQWRTGIAKVIKIYLRKAPTPRNIVPVALNFNKIRGAWKWVSKLSGRNQNTTNTPTDSYISYLLWQRDSSWVVAVELEFIKFSFHQIMFFWYNRTAPRKSPMAVAQRLHTRWTKNAWFMTSHVLFILASNNVLSQSLLARKVISSSSSYKTLSKSSP